PFTLYSDSKPIGANGETEDASQTANVKMVEVPGGVLTQSDGIELKPEDVRRLVAEAAELFAYAEDASGGDGNGQGHLVQAAYHPEDGLGSAQTTVIHKSVDQAAADDEEDNFDDLYAGAETKTLTVGRGDTLLSVITKTGAEPAQAK